MKEATTSGKKSFEFAYSKRKVYISGSTTRWTKFRLDILFLISDYDIVRDLKEATHVYFASGWNKSTKARLELNQAAKSGKFLLNDDRETKFLYNNMRKVLAYERHREGTQNMINDMNKAGGEYVE
jgi:hypothetical protein